MFGHDSQPSVIYRYGAKAPEEGSDVVAEQISAAHKYYNTLVEIERHRRQQAAEVVRRLSPDLESLIQQREELTGQIDAQRAQIKQANQRARRKTATKSFGPGTCGTQ